MPGIQDLIGSDDDRNRGIGRAKTPNLAAWQAPAEGMDYSGGLYGGGWEPGPGETNWFQMLSEAGIDFPQQYATNSFNNNIAGMVYTILTGDGTNLAFDFNQDGIVNVMDITGTIGDANATGTNPNLPSDEALKENIELIGSSPSGINVYEFDYKDKSYGEGRYKGVMAQEVPHASSIGPNGYLQVNYDNLDVNFERVA